MRIQSFLSAVLTCTLLAACGGGGDNPPVPPPPVVNVAPISNAGISQSVVVGTVVTLDASASSDSNRDTLTFSWTLTTKPAGSVASLSLQTSSKPSFTADIAGVYVASVMVNDGSLNSNAATVTITAADVNATPIANAGVSQNVVAGSIVTLDGSTSSDANSDPLTYVWTLTSRPVGSLASLLSTTSAMPTFTADIAGTYVVSLVVNDGKANSGNTATVNIVAAVLNVPPVANAGVAQNVTAGSLVTLDGSKSSDANLDSLTYAWTLTAKPTGSTAALLSTTSAMPTFVADVPGTYVASLTVYDGIIINSNIASVTVTATALNVAPIANAGVAQNVIAGGLVTLDGSTSSDANLDQLTFAWTLTSKPAGSSASLTSSMSAKPTFIADKTGIYVASLIVNDGKVNSSNIGTITITASLLNVAPMANAGMAQNVVAGTRVALDGSASSDANNDPLTFAWTLTSRPEGSTAVLSSVTTAKPTFTADMVGNYVASLIVNDGAINSSNVGTVTITAAAMNVAPIANAGVTQTIVAGTLVTLDGTASSDANKDSLTYSWTLTSKPAGSIATLSTATSNKPTFTADIVGTYIASLIVNDGKVNSSNVGTVSITAATLNVPPIANAGAIQNVLINAQVTLDGRASFDSNSDALTYSWVFVSKPAGSSTVLVGATSSTPSFIADKAGTYVTALVVNDGKLSSNTSTSAVTSTVGHIFSVIDGGEYNSAALKSDGTVWKWGNWDQVRSTPEKIPELSGIIAIGVGYQHAMALKSDGTVQGWGDNFDSRLGWGGVDDRGVQVVPVPVTGLTGVVAISAGLLHTVALKSDGSVMAWGNNYIGQLGDGTTINRMSPVAVPGLRNVIAVAAGAFYTMALKSDGSVWVWGDRAGGELPDGEGVYSATPVRVANIPNIAKITSNGQGDHRMVLTSHGDVWMWGGNTDGQLGRGTATGNSGRDPETWTPQRVLGLSGVLTIATGNRHSIAVKADGSVWTWGSNKAGQLGDGTTIGRTVPGIVSGISGVFAVAGGDAHTLAVLSDGSVWGWGANLKGQVGIGTDNPSVVLTPRSVFGNFNIKK